MYRELVTRSMEYVKYMREDGIGKQEIQAVFASIETDMAKMEQQATGNVKQEIEAIRELLKAAEGMLDSGYADA